MHIIASWGWVLIYVSAFGFSDALNNLINHDALRMLYYAVIGATGVILATAFMPHNADTCESVHRIGR